MTERDFLLLFARTTNAIAAMIEADIHEGRYGMQGRPNMTTLRMFTAMGCVADSNETVRKEIIEEAANFRQLVERIPPTQGVRDAFVGNPIPPSAPVNAPLRRVKTAGERAELLAILDGKEEPPPTEVSADGRAKKDLH